MHEFPNGGGPTDVFNEHILCCFISETIGVELIDHFNIDNVCWESDYPHSDSDWPNAPEVVAEALAPLNADAMRHYHFDPFKSRPKEQCTAAALRAESPDVDTVTRVGRLASDRDVEIFKAALHGKKAPAKSA